MLMFIRYVLLLTSLLNSVSALPLAPRDVVAPPITSPVAGAIWHVGQTQTVTWNTTGLPANQTNPVGMLVLGYQYNNSENLMLNSPLATNINYSDGQVDITVPNVPTRSDYIVVLFGDSGNASPEFTIINDASPSASIPSSPSSTSPPDSSPPPASTPATAPPPANSNPSGNSGGSSPEANAGSPTTVTPPTSQTSTTVVVATTPSPSTNKSGAAWQKHVPSIGTSFTAALTAIYFVFS